MYELYSTATLGGPMTWTSQEAQGVVNGEHSTIAAGYTATTCDVDTKGKKLLKCFPVP